MKDLTGKTEEREGPGHGDRLLARAHETGPRYKLATLRMALGTTQMQVAQRARMAQGDVSVLENRRDIKISTLGRYASALGGRLEVAVVIGDHRYIVEVGR